MKYFEMKEQATLIEIEVNRLKSYFYNDYKEENHSESFNDEVTVNQVKTDLICNSKTHTTKEREDFFFSEMMKSLASKDELMIEYVLQVN